MTHESPARDAVALAGDDLVAIRRELLGAALYCIRHQRGIESPSYKLVRDVAFSPAISTTPSPSSEYSRGVEDAAKVAEGWMSGHPTTGVVMWAHAASAIARNIRALTAQPQEGMVPDGWRPIETAPKDGTRILGLNSNGDQAVISWDGKDWLPTFGHEDSRKMWNVKNGGFWSGIATRWVSLPSTPIDDTVRSA